MSGEDCIKVKFAKVKAPDGSGDCMLNGVLPLEFFASAGYRKDSKCKMATLEGARAAVLEAIASEMLDAHARFVTKYWEAIDNQEAK